MRDGFIEPGLNVVVSYGEGDATVCCMGKVLERAINGSWWIDVYTGAAQPLPQMFRADDILGLASLGMMPRCDDYA